MRIAVLVALLSLCQVQDDLAKLQGTWKRVDAEVEGKKLPAAELQTTSLTIQKNKYTLNMGGQVRTGTLKLDPSKTPKHIDLSSDAGPNKGKILPGIYELDGDVFKYALSGPGKDRPTDFTAKPGQSVFVNKRAGP